MRQRQILSTIGASLGMLVLILDSHTALIGAEKGLELCMKTIIPSLFPFFLLSVLLTGNLLGARLPILKPLGNALGIPQGAESILLTGFFGGYPVGAQCIGAAFQAKQLSKEDAERMLSFCNNAGPAFLFGIVSSMFPRKDYAWALWGIHIASALLTGLLFSRPHKKASDSIPSHPPTLSYALSAAIKITASVCGWVILFRVVLAFLDRWLFWLLPAEVRVLLSGLLELSNGCCQLETVTNIPVRFLISSLLLACGGLCVTMQTASVTQGLSLRYYYRGKTLQSIFSILISLAFLYHNILPLLLILLILFTKMQKNSSIPSAIRV